MRQRIRRGLAILLSLFVFGGVAFTLPVDAASKPDLKKANVKWDLKANKTIKAKMKWVVIGAQPITIRMTNYKVKKLKNGYKKCTFTVIVRSKINPSKQQIYKMAEKYEDTGTMGGSFYWTVVDYKTGKSLNAANDKDVTVTDTGWINSKYKKLKGKDGSWIRYARKSKIKVTVVYPATYKDLAIGIGGCSKVKYKLNSYWNGKKSYSKTKGMWDKKDRSYAHFKRVK